jgi:hypothetical protein
MGGLIGEKSTDDRNIVGGENTACGDRNSDDNKK